MKFPDRPLMPFLSFPGKAEAAMRKCTWASDPFGATWQLGWA